MSKTILCYLSISTVLIILSGCTTVSPWERGALSTPSMEFGMNAADEAIDDHLYFSKEATSGGRGFGGGGCGCN